MSFCATHDIGPYDVKLSQVTSSVTRGEIPKVVGVAGKPGRSRWVYSVQLSSAPADSPVELQTPFPRAAYLSSLPTRPTSTKSTVAMEAISNHAEEEVRRVVTSPFGFFVGTFGLSTTS